MSAGAAIELEGITVRYGAVVANRDVSLAAAPGEVHAIVGENGAGKSTLLRAVQGLAPIASGHVRVRGEEIARPSPASMIARGVGMVHQHFLLVEALGVAENVVLGCEPVARGGLASALGVLDRTRAEAEVAALAERFGWAIDPRAGVADLSVGERQRVEILKAMHRGARVLLLDEPTAVLTPPEVAELFRLLRALREDGGTVLLVTHKLDEVMALADRVTVLRRGEVVARYARAEASAERIASAMVGGAPEAAIGEAWREATLGEVRLELRDLTVTRDGGRRALDGVSLAVRAGEIVGVAGVDGNGQAELCAAIAGLEKAARGELRLDGVDVTRATAAARRRRGLGYVPDDRQRLGLLLDSSVAENLMLGREEAYARAAGLDRARLAAAAARALEDFDVRPAGAATVAAPMRALSGGNQQKILVARELLRAPRVLVAAQPTRGVDLAAAARIHRQLLRARDAGCAVLLLSAELDELRALSDRVAVLHRGHLVATLARADATHERLGALMTGASA